MSGKKDDAGCAAGFQDTARTVRAGSGYRHLSLYDAFPACRYLDTFGVMDAYRT